MKKVILLNAYGAQNIGDYSILRVALSIINKSLKGDAHIEVLCEDPKFNVKIEGIKAKITFKQLPYGYAITSSYKPASSILKIIRFCELIFFTFTYVFLNKILNTSLPNRGIYSYIKSIKNSESVIGMGGGYFISRNRLTDFFGVVLTLLPIYVAKAYRKQILFLPMSFGPFASDFHEKLVIKAIAGSIIMVRENISFKLLSKYVSRNNIKIIYIPDLALFLKYEVEQVSKFANRYRYIVLTVREWLLEAKQNKFENAIASLVKILWFEYKLKTVFIPMSFNRIEENDWNVANRLSKIIGNNKYFSVLSAKDPTHVQNILKYAEMGVFTRMHSMILAMTVKTPFVPIGYGHKTLGLLKKAKLGQWYLDINQVDSNVLLKKFKKLYINKNRDNFLKNIDTYMNENKKYESFLYEQINVFINKPIIGQK